jgi:creatinine amidohydrolase
MADEKNETREIRMERLRPGQLNAERERCPLVFVPVGPLEYHGPHLPVGTDAINATECALEACRRLGQGVVHPTLYWGTERERPEWMLESLGFEKKDWIVGMDFPSAIWKSHYYREEVFALVVSQALEMLIAGGYRVIVLVNGHGAWNQLESLERLARHYSHTTEALVVWKLAFTLDVSEKNLAGHADLYETSLLLYYQGERFGGEKLVDLGTLPERDVPIRYPQFSIVDGAGFSENPSPGRVVQTDPRDATVEKGKTVFEDTVRMYVDLAGSALREKGLG